MKLYELLRPVIRESYEDYRNTRWAHHSNHEMLTVRTKTFHNDPSGIYFFPLDYQPTASMWHQMKYRYVVELVPQARVLDLPQISTTDVATLLQAVGQTEAFAAYLQQYPPENHRDMVRMLWSHIRNSSFRFHGQWNKIIRSMGYEAVFDDSGIIHSAEPIQLLVLDPRAIVLIDRATAKPNYFGKMKKVVDELAAVCATFGVVTTEPPRKKRGSWSSTPMLMARVEVHRSEENYATFNVIHDQTDQNMAHMIRVHMGYSRPYLNHGVGATYNAAMNKWDYTGLNSIVRDLNTIFAADELKTPESMTV
jgi:hypothetical protein